MGTTKKQTLQYFFEMIARLVQSHLDIWRENDSTKRLKLAGEVYAENIRVTDPEIILNGRRAVSDFIGQLLNQHPGFKFRIAKPVEVHHETAVLSWEFGPDTNPGAITGTDIFTISGDKISALLTIADGLTPQLN